MLNNKNTVILDFDNTLYDWVDQWYFCFRSMLDKICEISGLPESVLKPEIRKVFQLHHTSEYSFLIESLPIINAGSRETTIKKYQPAIDAYKAARDEHLHLYDGTLETLRRIKSLGKTLVVFTESQTFYSLMRLKRFNLDGVIDFIYTSQDSEPENSSRIRLSRKHESDRYALNVTKHRSIRLGRLKPEPEILKQIISELGTTASDSIYIGDSLYKDVLMGNQANVDTVWARYGHAVSRPEYNLLREVSHWTDADIDLEKKLRQAEVCPTFEIDSIYALVGK